nr:MAG TPA: hypothetical protein [Caudoviricetes sp.]
MSFKCPQAPKNQAAIFYGHFFTDNVLSSKLSVKSP